MRYWWVNHKQTFRHEFSGNYIWSPKTKRGGALNRFYETMREVAPGDVIFSYAGGVIRGFGIAKTNCYTSPRPDEFGHIGEVWDEIGWRASPPCHDCSVMLGQIHLEGCDVEECPRGFH